MSEPFLLSRVLVQFDQPNDAVTAELSSAVFTPDGSLWTGSDEQSSIERLSPLEPCVYGQHRSFLMADFIELFDAESEIDIEGMDFSEPFLWFTGSHSQKRRQPKGKKDSKDIERLGTVKNDANRYLLARVPVQDGELVRSHTLPEHPERQLRAAALRKSSHGNILIDALMEDEHLGRFVRDPVPSKENGLDIEGIACRGNRVWLGLRGPVLRGWAVMLELELEEGEPRVLEMKPFDTGRPYRKHFVDLNGLGIRELLFQEEDLLLLAGPTMEHRGFTRVYRLKGVLDRDKDSVIEADGKELELLFTLPFSEENNAEGLALMPCLGFPDSLLVAYDLVDQSRLVGDRAVFMDVFRLPARKS